jgi:hypothetical protein
MKGKIISCLVGLITLFILISGCSRPVQPPSPQSVAPPTSVFPMGMGRETPATTVEPTILPKDTTPEEYVEKYYKLLTEKKYGEAFAMAPVETRQRDTTQNFAKARESMPIKSFNVLKAKKPDENTIEVSVELELGGMAEGQIWVTTWTFIKQDGKWIAQKTHSLPKQ